MFPTISLLPNEQVITKINANHTEKNIAMGGKLWFTTLGVRFIPHRFNPCASILFIPYKEITRVYKKGISLKEPFSGGLVHRLAIATKNLGRTLFCGAQQTENHRIFIKKNRIKKIVFFEVND